MTRELDARIAERVMGWRHDEYGGYDTPTGYRLPDEIPPYSTDIRAAWEVVERMGSIKMDTDEGYQRAAPFIFAMQDIPFWRLKAHDAALAICQAALAALRS